VNKNSAKTTVTISMLAIFAMAFVMDPAWVRGARDFILEKAGGTAPAQPTGGSSSKVNLQ
jgi:hypothetical protein